MFRAALRPCSAILAALGMLSLGGCGHMPTPRVSSCAALPPSALAARPSGTATLDVLTYNIEGLPWPARSGRAPQLARIGKILDDLRESGGGPDIILFQEAFSRSAIKGIKRAGYPDLAAGPSRTQRGMFPANAVLPGKAKAWKGELGLRFLSAGLVIASRHPIVTTASEPYSRGSCAGFDCLANKGVLLATIILPGVPEPVQLVNTHMNSQYASGVKERRHRKAHKVQTGELSRFMRHHLDYDRPVILGGDFNMRRAPERFEIFNDTQPLELVHEFCIDPASGCDVRMSWDGDAPWMDTQDLQLFTSGREVQLRPISVEAMFDGSENSPKLSDHDGLRVTYQLEWNGSRAITTPCP